MNLKAEKTRDDQDEDLNEDLPNVKQTASFGLNDWRNSMKAVVSVLTLRDRRQN